VLHAKEVPCSAPGNSRTSLSDLNSRPAGTVSEPAREARPRLLVQARATLTYGCLRHELASWPVIRPAGQLRRQDRDMRTPPAGFEGPSRTETRLPACTSVNGPTLVTSVRLLVLHSIGKLGRPARCRPPNRAPAARHGAPTRRGSREPAAAPFRVSGEYLAARIPPCMCALRYGTPPSTHALPRPLRPCQPSAPFNRLQASGNQPLRHNHSTARAIEYDRASRMHG
jgi:hypothetical protein